MTSYSGARNGGGKKNPQKGGGGSSSKGPASSLSNTPGIPPPISFYVRIQPLTPDYGGQPIRHTDGGHWVPPNRPIGLTNGRDPAILLRWEDGRVTVVPGNNPLQGPGLDGNVYQTATVFTQKPDTPHLLVVPFDARTRNVQGRGWHCITFNHNRIENSNRYYSYVSAQGAEQKIAAPCSQRWMDQLLPAWYDCDARHETRTQAGLTGELSLLFALAAFSAPPASQGLLRQFIAPGKWMSHNQNTGHIPERGMVVTVYFDPHNQAGSTRDLLDRLQNGEFGPFYGPN